MTARGPLTEPWGLDEDDVPFTLNDNPADGDDYTYDSRVRADVCDARYADLAGRLNSALARIADLERQMAQWTADS